MQYQRNSRFSPAIGMGRCYAKAERDPAERATPISRGHESAARLISAPSLAMVYSPHQEFDELYDHATALCRGTLFTELDKPFFGGRCQR